MVAVVELVWRCVVGSKTVVCATQNTTSCGCCEMGPVSVDRCNKYKNERAAVRGETKGSSL